MHVYTTVFHIVHPGIAVVVYSALGRARSIVMCCVQYGLRQGPGKWFRGPRKNHGILCNQASGNPVLNNLILAAAASVWNSLPDLVSSPDTFYSVCWRIKTLFQAAFSTP